MTKQSKITLKYGKTSLDMQQPAGKCLGVLKPKRMSALKDIEAEVAKALENPIGSLPLSEIVGAGDRVTIITSDITRYSATEVFLPHLLNALNRSGVWDSDITVLFALGIHRAQTDEEHISLLGWDVARRVRLVDHDPHDRDNLVHYGETLSNTPVYINRLAAECDKLILTGTITLHYFAGFGGGRKALIPGVAGYETCMANHLLVLKPDKGGKHPMVKTAQLEGNPLHEDLVEGCLMVNPHFGLYTLLNDDREIGRITAGDVFDAHIKGCDELMHRNSVDIKKKADLVIASCGGFPKDLNVIQTHKTMEYSYNALKEGGVMILVGECTDGFGNSTMHSWFQHKQLRNFEKALRDNYEINGQTAYSIFLKSKKAKIIMVSGLPEQEVKDMSITPAPSLDDALAKAEKILGKRYSYYLIPDGSNLLPVVS